MSWYGLQQDDRKQRIKQDDCKQRDAAFRQRVESIEQDSHKQLTIGTKRDNIARFYAEQAIPFDIFESEAIGTLNTTGGCAPLGCGTNSALIGVRVKLDRTGSVAEEAVVVAMYKTACNRGAAVGQHWKKQRHSTDLAMGVPCAVSSPFCLLDKLRVDSAQQLIAEVGPTAATFPAAKHLSSWMGACPGNEESAGADYSHRSPQGNRLMRRILNQSANAAAKAKGTISEVVHCRTVPRLGHKQTIGTIAHRLCRLIWLLLPQGVRYEERGRPSLRNPSKGALGR